MFGKKETTTVEINGKRSFCQVFRHDQFWRRRVELNATVLTLFRLDWPNCVSTSVVDQ